MAVSTKLIRLTETEADSAAAAGGTTADDTTRVADGDADEGGGPTLGGWAGTADGVPPALADR